MMFASSCFSRSPKPLGFWFVGNSLISGGLGAFVLAVSPGLASEPSPAPRQFLDPTVSYTASQQKAVPALRQAELRKLQAMYSLIRQDQVCLERSMTLEALTLCHQQSHQAMANLRKIFHKEISGLRDSYGLPRPIPQQAPSHGQSHEG